MQKTVITYSEMSALRECRLQHHFKYERKLIPKVTSQKLTFGHFGHLVLQTLYSTKSIEFTSDALKKLIADYEDQIKNSGLPEQEIHIQKLSTLEFSAAIISYLFNQGKKDLERFQFIDIEKTFEIPVLHPISHRKIHKMFFAGKIDAIATDKETNQTVILEHKFLRSFDADVDMQISAYCYAYGRLSGTFPSYVIYNVIYKPNLKKDSTKDLTDFSERARKSVENNPPIKINVSRGPEDYRIFEEELYEASKEKRKVNAYKHRNVDTNPGGHCSWKCAFKDICMKPNDQHLIEKLFDVRTKEHEELPEGGA